MNAFGGIIHVGNVGRASSAGLFAPDVVILFVVPLKLKFMQ